MSNRNVSQAIKNSIRKEIRSELEQAIAIKAERGTIVSSQGDVARFSIRYLGNGKPLITVYGIETFSVADAASTVLWNWEYTR